MKLICKTCKTIISKEVVELKDLKLLNDIDGKDYIPEGFFIVGSQEEYPSKKGLIIINIKDLINSKHHSDESRLNGCCGQDGQDGMNRICVNNHEIGTENSDCWMAHFIGLDPEYVTFI